MKPTARNILNRLKSLWQRDMGYIAVIIPVYNKTAYLEETLRSAAIQDYAYKEIIVVDDGSSEEAAEEIERICALFSDVILLRQPQNIGPAAARNRGIEYTSAELIFFLDGDDILCPGALRYLAASLYNNPGAIAAYGKIKYINENGDVVGRRSIEMPSGSAVLGSILERLLCFCNGSICIRKSALERLSLDNHTMKYGEDWVLWCHLALSGNIIYAGEHIVLYYRLHKGSVSAKMPDAENYVALLAAYDSVYNDPVFIKAVGEEKLRKLKEKCLHRLHMTLAGTCSLNGQLKEAEYYFSKANMTTDALEHP